MPLSLFSIYLYEIYDKSFYPSKSFQILSFLGNFIPADNSLKGKNGSFYGKHGGFCLETQTFPDAVNQSFDHDSILRPGQVYDHQVMYKFFF